MRVMNGRLSKDAVVDDLAARLAARRAIATGRRAGYNGWHWQSIDNPDGSPTERRR